MSVNKNCFLFIQVMQRKRREDGHQNVAGISKCQRGSSFVVGNMYVFVNPLSATPLFSPSSLARVACAVRPRGFHAAGSESRTSPKFAARRLLQGNAPVVPPFQHGLVNNGKFHLGHRSFRRGT
jgi:hypothetical protein